ncbi:hypothetical protein E4656_17240 [Natronospirillum operosum]|uniref:Haemolysin-type calcium binding-related domain-containing protein n=1 Tax=Natronospirillum operosum TaxID=2759953 RepID=A0A4Z0W2F9_9GAMM|nr:calcium-binding protein [Natronospirillum operosum]TGG91134.1 hypothetical protein E4656_17240 [Natronospirillum operosum]
MKHTKESLIRSQLTEIQAEAQKQGRVFARALTGGGSTGNELLDDMMSISNIALDDSGPSRVTSIWSSIEEVATASATLWAYHYNINRLVAELEEGLEAWDLPPLTEEERIELFEAAVSAHTEGAREILQDNSDSEEADSNQSEEEAGEESNGGGSGGESGSESGSDSGGESGSESGGDSGGESGGDSGGESGGDSGGESGGSSGGGTGGSSSGAGAGGGSGSGGSFFTPPPPPPPNPGPIPGSPIVLNLEGEAIDTTGLDEEIHFDLNGNGFREQTGWITPDQGFLVLDRNGDGIINDGTELFGNWTELGSGTTAANGFEALAEFDENGDGVIDAQDSIYSELRVWVDLDQDGVSDSGELFTLAELGIASISLEYSTSNHTDEHGNEFRQWGHFTTVDGIQRDAVDIWFHKDPTLTQEQELDVSADIAALPDMQGYGTAHSLHQAMVRDETGNLKVLVKQFTEETNSERRQELIEDILYEWTGQTEDDKTKFGNRYDFVDGRKIGVLEAFTGHSIGGPRGTGRQYAEQFHGQFNQWASVVYSQLMMQSHLSDIFAEADFTWNEELQTWTGHFDQSTEALVDRMLSHPDQSAALLSDYISVIEGINPYNNANKHAAIASMLEISQNHDLSPELANLISSTLFEGDQWLMTAFTDALAGDSSDLEIVQNWMAGHSGGQIITGEPQETGSLRGTAGDDLLIAGKNDRLYAGGGNDTLIGAEGARLYGESGDNLLVAATDSQLHGGSGSDTYQIGSDVLTTTIRHNNRNNQDAGTLSFGDGIKAEDLRLERHGSHLHFVHGDQRIVMNRWFDNHRYRVAQIQFADGEPLDISEWLQAQVVYSEADPGDQTLNGHSGVDHMVGHDEGVNTLRGGNGDDTLIAGKNDRLYAGGGNDTLIGAEGARLYGESGDNLLVAATDSQLQGGSGSDTYQIGSEVLTTTIRHNNRSNQDAGTLSFGDGIKAEDLRLERHGSHLHFVHGDQRIVMNRWFDNHRYRVAQIQFADGEPLDISEWLQAQVVYSEANPGDQTLNGHSGVDHMVGHDEGVNTLRGGNGDDTLIAGKNDRLYAGGGNDTLIGAEGARLYGESGDNLLVAASDSQLYGGSGTDTFLFKENVDGASVQVGSASDKAVFENADPSQIWLSRSGNHLLIDLLHTEETVRIDDWFRRNDRQLAELKAGDSVATTAQIEKLVSAMAAFSPSEASDDSGSITSSVQEELKDVLSANWGTAA